MNLAEQCCVLGLMKTIIQTTIKLTCSGPTGTMLEKCNSDEACKILENCMRMRTSTIHYQKSLLSGRKTGGEGRGGRKTQTETENPFIPPTPQTLSLPITEADYSRTPLYGKFSLSLRKALSFTLIQPLNMETDPFMRETDTFF